ncbi:VanZ family protein [Actinacidiphila glaucinigra]|uniref:VanZ family protein n=1 Tax=Actinacidiphila glaucinigra TaxID=235986 RepID=UPI0037F7AD81
MALAFVAMVAFGAVLARATLAPSYASEGLAHANLQPGASLRQYYERYTVAGAVRQVGGNLLLGMPFGVLLPVLAPRARGALRVVVTTGLVMVLVELAQGAVVQGRAFDIDDVIMNTAGALLGYLLFGRRLGRAVHDVRPAAPAEDPAPAAKPADGTRTSRFTKAFRRRGSGAAGKTGTAGKTPRTAGSGKGAGKGTGKGVKAAEPAPRGPFPSFGTVRRKAARRS